MSTPGSNKGHPAPPAAAAPWRALFLEHVGAMQSPEFVLSTVRKVRLASAPAAEGGEEVRLSPRARTCIYRGLWAELPVNPKNTAELNPGGVYAGSDLPTLITDARMDKTAELLGLEVDDDTGDGGGGGGVVDSSSSSSRASGGGAWVEAMWWAAEPRVQWRIRGRAYVLGPDADAGSRGAQEARAALQARMRRVLHPGDGEEKEKEEEEGAGGRSGGGGWSFAREVTAHFGNTSPGMRGQYRNPPPGRPRALPLGGGGDDDDGSRLSLGQKVTDNEDPLARDNFRVVVIVPHEVDQTDLSDPDEGRRWMYHYLGGGGGVQDGPRRPGGVVDGEWEKVEVWP